MNLEIDARERVEFYLAEGQRLPHMGSWAFDATGFKYWAPELFAIHANYLALVHPDDRGLRSVKQSANQQLSRSRQAASYN